MNIVLALMFMLCAGNNVIGQNNFVNTCLHYGCTMSAGLHVQDLDGVIGQNLPPGEFHDNVITTATYDISQGDDTQPWEERKGRLCAYLNQLNAKILGLQGVKDFQFHDLTKCLYSYSYVANPIDEYAEEKVYNPIFYQHSGRLSFVGEGSFWLSKTPNTSASQLSEKYDMRMFQWVRLTFAERKSEYPIMRNFGFSGANDGFGGGFDAPHFGESVFQKVLRLLKIYTGVPAEKSPPKPPPLPPPRSAGEGANTPKFRMQYRQFDLYVVNGKLNPDNKYVAHEEARVLAKHLRHNVLDRRQFPLMLMGNFGHEDDSPMYELLNRKKWLKNSMAMSKSVYPSMTYYERSNGKESLIDYVWYNRFNNLFSAVMTDVETDHKPVFAAFSKKRRR